MRFKPEILERTTFTGGDSLDQVSIPGSENLRPRVVPDPVRHPTWLAFPQPVGDVLQYETLEQLLQAMFSTTPRLHYVEAQYHGEVRLGDVKEVIFLKEPPNNEALRRMNEEIRRLLKQEGIPYREAWQPENSGPIPGPDPHEDGGTR
jgi:hypothetical protein